MFEFIEYIHPSWYYGQMSTILTPIIRNAHDLPEPLKACLDTPQGYHSPHALELDMALQALHKGFIPDRSTKRISLQNTIVTNVEDNYRFVSRFYGRSKALMILLIRLLSLHNPFLEWNAFLKTRSVSKQNLYEAPEIYNDFKQFDSKLLEEKPLISVIIPTLNRYEYLKDVLSDLEKQTYTNFEVLVCDQSDPLQEEFYKNWKCNLTLIPQKEKALWLARNQSIEKSKGAYILLFDDDSRVEPNWIEQHLRCLDFFKAHISAGVTNTLVGHGLSPKEVRFHLSDVFDTGNALVKRTVFEKVGLFDRQFEKQRMGDGEFGKRALEGGFVSISNPFATRIHLKVETGGLREMGSWDALRPKKIFAPRPVPSVLYYIRKYYGNRNGIWYLIANIPFSFIPYAFKKSKKMKWLSLVILPLVFPLMFVVSARSWRQATQKLKEGANISFLK
jgi:glycosyltransferase involved in cell wall biosynthesis